MSLRILTEIKKFGETEKNTISPKNILSMQNNGYAVPVGIPYSSGIVTGIYSTVPSSEIFTNCASQP